MASITIDSMISELQEAKEKYGNLPLVYAEDAEGNDFHAIAFTPTAGHFNAEDDEFNSEDNLSERRITEIKEGYDIDESDFTINALCIN